MTDAGSSQDIRRVPQRTHHYSSDPKLKVSRRTIAPARNPVILSSMKNSIQPCYYKGTSLNIKSMLTLFFFLLRKFYILAYVNSCFSC